MESATGWSLRLGSAAFWITTAVACCAWLANVLVAVPSFIQLFRPFGYFRTYISVIMMCSATLLPMLMQWWLVISPRAGRFVKPSSTRRRLPAWRILTWIGSPMRAMKLLLFVSVSGLSAHVFVSTFLGYPMYRTTSARSASSWYLGMPLGTVQALILLILGWDRICYPVIHRKRWMRIKGSYHDVLSVASYTLVHSIPVSLLVFALTPSPIPSIQEMGAILVACVLCSLCWSFSAVLINLVLSERLYLAHLSQAQPGTVMGLLIERLTALSDPINTALTLQELSLRSDFQGINFWQDLFTDHLGAIYWSPLASRCLSQLDALIQMASQYLAAHRESTKFAKSARWNSCAVSTLRRLPQPLMEQLLLEDYLQNELMPCIWSASILTDIAVLSHTHDACGLLQMPPPGVPGFADVLQVLLHAYVLLDKFMLHCSRHQQRDWVAILPGKVGDLLGLQSSGKGNQKTVSPAGAAAESLQQALGQCLHRLHVEFKRPLLSAVSSAKWAAPVQDKNLDMDAIGSALLGG